MRRRPPHLLHLSPGEVAYLKTLVEDGRTEQRIARRARALLAMTDPDTVVSELADRLELERTTIWNLCRRYSHTATLLPDGRVLAVGGASHVNQASAELYTEGRWSQDHGGNHTGGERPGGPPPVQPGDTGRADLQPAHQRPPR